MPSDGHLLHSLASHLETALSRSLPGLAAQRLMAPHDRIGPGYDPNPAQARQSAVLLVLVPDNHGEVSLLYIERASSSGPHSGQIAFPGGMAEPEDADLVDTALRECHEETGLLLPRASVLGTLTRLYIDVSRFSVLPVVAWTGETPELQPEPSEVSRAFLISLRDLRASVGVRGLDRRGTHVEVPCYSPADTVIWGATAMITAEFLALADQIG
jgi:8-oxo-dGTP pyrophosphatase MutT (NUDIX family)